MKKITLLIILVLFAFLTAFAQQDAQYTQYMYNTMSVNPAYAGSRGLLSFTGMYRNQWLGLEGAPESQTLNIHAPLKDSKWGVGISVINDQIGDGVNQETYLDLAASYTIQTSFDGKLSFGIKAGGSFLNIDFTRLNQYDNVEYTDAENIENQFSPNIGAGVYYHTEKFYAGLSVPNLLETEYFADSNNSNTNSSSWVARERINYYFITGYVFELDYWWKFKPAALTKIVTGAPAQIDLSANFMYNDSVTFGVGYRLNAAFTAMTAFHINEALSLGLAYDREVTALGGTQFNSGSVEFFLRFELARNYKRVTGPRFF